MKNRFTLLSWLMATSVLSPLFGQTVSDFENINLATDSYWDGVGNANTSFASGDALFENTYSGFWSTGFAVSNKKDVTTAGYKNTYSAITGIGVNRSSNYAVAQTFSQPTIKFPAGKSPQRVRGLYVTNSTYAYLSMLNSDQFGKKFGGNTGNDPDYFLLTIKGYYSGSEILTPVKFYLADFRYSDNKKDYIVNTWKWVDLSVLGLVDSLKFDLSSSDVGNWGMNTPAYFCIDNFNQPYFADVVGSSTTNAIHKDSNIVLSWANKAIIQRGFKDIGNTSLGYTSVGTESSALGIADGSVVSLGDGGTATLSFENYITNGEGPDFCIYENSFSDTYLELATVAVSSDGIRFVELPAISNTQDTLQVGGFGSLQTKYLHNIAGKYQANYGTPFDLNDIKDSLGIDINKIAFVKIKDVIGNIDTLQTLDINNNPINDPWSTPYASGGFDLDAVGVINVGTVVATNDNLLESSIELYPNPAKQSFVIKNYVGKLEVFNLQGVKCLENSFYNQSPIDISHFTEGIYLVKTEQGILKLAVK